MMGLASLAQLGYIDPPECEGLQTGLNRGGENRHCDAQHTCA